MISWNRTAPCRPKLSKTSKLVRLPRQRWQSFRKIWLSTSTKRTIWSMKRTWHKHRWALIASTVDKCTKTLRWARAWRFATLIRSKIRPSCTQTVLLSSFSQSFVSKTIVHRMILNSNSSNQITISREAPWTALDLSLIALILAEAMATKVPRLAQEQEVMHLQRRAANWIYSLKSTGAKTTDALVASTSSNASSMPLPTESKSYSLIEHLEQLFYRYCVIGFATINKTMVARQVSTYRAARTKATNEVPTRRALSLVSNILTAIIVADMARWMIMRSNSSMSSLLSVVAMVEWDRNIQLVCAGIK